MDTNGGAGQGRAQFDGGGEELNQVEIISTKNQDLSQSDTINNEFTVFAVSPSNKEKGRAEREETVKTRFKRHVATFLDHMGIGEFELTVDMAREQFEAKKGRLLTSDEKACFSSLYLTRRPKRLRQLI